MAEIALIVPCFNEAQRLDVSAFSSYDDDAHRVQFLFVDDGSTDATRAVLEKMRDANPQRVDVLGLDANVGKAEAVRRGFVHALARNPRYVGFWDADLATPLNEVARFVAVLDSRPDIHMVFGSRVKMLGRAIERSEVRHYLGRVFATVVSTMLHLGVYDTQCGAKLFRASDALRRAVAEPCLTRWLLDIEIVARFMNDPEIDGDVADLIYELPLDAWSEVGGSKVHPLDFVKAIGSLAKIHRVYDLGARRRRR